MNNQLKLITPNHNPGLINKEHL